MIKKAGDFKLERRPIAGGNGDIEFHHIGTKEDAFGKCRLVAELTVEPGGSVGQHAHVDEMEIYYMLQGQLVSIGEDGSEEPFLPGDTMFTGGGAKHAVRNDSDSPATFLAIIVL